MGFGVSLRAATSNLPSSPNLLSNRGAVLHDGRKHTRPSSFHNPTLSADKHVVQICRSSLSAAVQTVQVERRTSPFNGIERSLSRAVVINTKSLPVSATTFPTALSLYIEHDRRKHKHNPKLSANNHVVQICRSSLSAAADGLADCSGERRTLPVNGDAQKIAQSCCSPTISARLHNHVSNSVVFVHRAGTLAKGYPLSKMFSKAEPLPFEKETNINLVYFSCLKHVNEMVLGDPRQAHQRAQSFPSISSFINHSTLLLECSSAKLLVFTCTRTLDRLGSERVDAFGLRAVEVIICMITRDFSVISIDVTGVSLSLSTTTTTTTTTTTPHDLQRSPAVP